MSEAKESTPEAGGERGAAVPLGGFKATEGAATAADAPPRDTSRFLPLLRCPVCAKALETETACPDGHEFPRDERGWVDYITYEVRPDIAEDVTSFYDRFPFPGYAPGEDAASLTDRCRKAPFLTSLDAAIPADATVVDCGCGTGQLAAFMALSASRRRVVGVDACRNSLGAAAGFRNKVGIDNLHLVRGDLFALPLAEQQFDVVISRGVVHHTPDPERAILEVGKRVKPGGYFVLGFYETAARAQHVARRRLFKLLGRRIRVLDPIMRRKDITEDKVEIWYQDQYEHPLEKILPFQWVRRVTEAEGFTWIRSLPPVVEDDMFVETPRPSAFGLWARRMGWAVFRGHDADAGLVCLVARKPG